MLCGNPPKRQRNEGRRRTLAISCSAEKTGIGRLASHSAPKIDASGARCRRDGADLQSGLNMLPAGRPAGTEPAFDLLTRFAS
jgi:hypothetical protein